MYDRSTGLQCRTYGMIYGAMGSYGTSSMGFMGTYVLAVWDSWDLWEPMGFRLRTYGIRRGLWDCGVAYEV